MGLLRLLLAISVLIAHSYTFLGYRLLGAQLAVDTFFVISGFYMAFILHTKYIGKNGSYSLFLTNRFLRIYPLYWAMLFLTFAFALIKYVFFPAEENVIAHFINTFSQSPFFVWHCIETIVRNVTLLVTTDYVLDKTSDPGHLILLQAWTLQVELLFYIIAPFVVRKKTFVLILTGVFALVTFAHIIPGVHATNWVTPAFLYSFVFFLIGILSYMLYTWIQTKKSLFRFSRSIFISFILFLLLFGYLVTYVKLPHIQNGTLLYFLIVCLALPFIFFYSKKRVWDAQLGALSYPVYLSHFFVYKAIANSPLHSLNQTALSVITILATILFSYILVVMIEKPIDRIRAARLKANARKKE